MHESVSSPGLTSSDQVSLKKLRPKESSRRAPRVRIRMHGEAMSFEATERGC